jgi:hypothetical protein
MKKNQKAMNRQIKTAKLLTTINLAFAALLIPKAPVQALEFNFIYKEGTRQEVIDGFKTAGDIWSSHINDDTNVNIFIGFDQLTNSNALGGARPDMVRFKYSDYLDKYLQNITSEDDLLAFKNMQIDSKDQTEISDILQGKTLEEVNIADISTLQNNLEFEKNSKFSIVNYKNQLKNNNNQIWLTRGNAKSLDLIPADQGLDAQIMINEQFDWDFSRVNDPTLTTIDANKYDFLGVALHEIGHALGFVSGVDAFTVLNTIAETNGSNLTENEDSKYITSLDMFRYSEQSRISSIPDFSPQGDKYFSIDGGVTNLGYFDGDKYQTSHWRVANNGSELGIMNPTMSKGRILNISALDLQSLDVIGWNRGSSTSINNTLPGNLEADQENSLRENSVFDNGIRRSRRGSTVTGYRFWQEKNKVASEYSNQENNNDLVEYASLPVDLDQMLAIQANDHVSVPEPNAIAGLGIIGLFGIGRCCQRRRKSTYN